MQSKVASLAGYKVASLAGYKVALLAGCKVKYAHVGEKL